MSKTESENKSRVVLQILASNESMTSEEITKQCSFESRMATAGILAMLRRQQAIELVPESYRITETGKGLLGQPKQEPVKIPEPAKPKKMNKGLKVSAVKREFKRLNPDVDESTIDWIARVDDRLRIPENMEILAKTYPTFKWKKDKETKNEERSEQGQAVEKSS